MKPTFSESHEEMISVVIPAFNEERFLPRCLESLKNQDYKGDYEIIVVDNGSQDNTGRIAKQFGCRVIPCLKKGVVYARQAGAEAASGKIIVQADADTIYPEDWLTRIDRYFSSHPDSAALAGIYRYEQPPWWARAEYVLRYLANVLCLLFLGRALWMSGANFAFRREAFLQVNGYDARSMSPDQWGISYRLSKVGKVHYDRTLLVVTSPRRVKKPLYVLFFDFMSNTARALAYFSFCNFRAFSLRLPLLHSPAKLATPIFLAGVISFLAYGYVVPSAQVFGKVYYQSKTPEKVVALTFDDGPNEPYTSEVLNILKNYDVKATFFVIGRNVELYPQTARRIVAEGHDLGNHSYTHNANHALTNYGRRDIELAQEAIFNVVGFRPRFYRPPHGKKSPWELDYLKQENLVEVTWDVSTNELHDELIFGKPEPEEVAREIIQEVKPGKIILLHDGYGTHHNDAKSDKSLTTKALPIIIEQLQSQGYRFVTVSELLGMPPYND